MFQGFTPEAVEFLWGIKFNNNREWFLPRKEQFLALVDRPMRELGSEIFDAIAAAYPKQSLKLHVCHIHNAGIVGKTAAGGGVDVRRFHLRKARLYISEHEHDFGNTLIGGKAEDSGAGVQYVNLACAQIVRQSAVVPGEVGLIDHLVGKRLVVAPCDDFTQRDLHGKLIAPIEGVKGNGGTVLDL